MPQPKGCIFCVFFIVDGRAVTSPKCLEPTILEKNFGFSMIPNIIDVQVALTSTPAIPGFNTALTINYKNIGTEIISGAIEYVYDDSLSIISSSQPWTSHINDTIRWNYDSLLVGENRQIQLVLSLQANTSLLGDTLKHFVNISPILSDTSVINNYDSLLQIVKASYNANYKAVEPKGHTSECYITVNDSILEYEIHFQNNNTDTAFKVVIIDTLSQYLDIQTIKMIGASHNYNYKVRSMFTKRLFNYIVSFSISGIITHFTSDQPYDRLCGSPKSAYKYRSCSPGY